MYMSVDQIDEEIRNLRKEKDRQKEVEAQRELADTTRMVYQSYVDAGFTEEQAFEIFMTLLKK